MVQQQPSAVPSTCYCPMDTTSPSDRVPWIDTLRGNEQIFGTVARALEARRPNGVGADVPGCRSGHVILRILIASIYYIGDQTPLDDEIHANLWHWVFTRIGASAFPRRKRCRRSRELGLSS